MPCVSFIPWTSDQEQVQIARGVLSFRCSITRKNASAIQEGTLYLAPAPLRIGGRLEWLKLFTPSKQLVITLLEKRREATLARTHAQTAHNKAQTLRITCTQCSKERTTHYHSLLGPKGWRRIWCKGPCRKAWVSKKWNCACGMLWHKCALHAHGNFQVPPKPAARNRNTRPCLPQPAHCPMPAKRAKQGDRARRAHTPSTPTGTSGAPAHTNSACTCTHKARAAAHTPLHQPMPAKRAKLSQCTHSLPDRTSPAASRDPPTTPRPDHDPRTCLKRKAEKSERGEPRTRPTTSGPGFLAHHTAPAPRQERSDCPPLPRQ